jgi:hypothetical protein
MPLLHRLACLRDDVVFLVYLYQKWIYPEDKRRRNEFGQVGEADADGESDDEDESVKLLKEGDEVKDTLLAKEKKEDKEGAPRERKSEKTTSRSRSKSPLKSPSGSPSKGAKKDL